MIFIDVDLRTEMTGRKGYFEEDLDESKEKQLCISLNAWKDNLIH